MNEIIDTSTRLFMAVIGPSGSGKTELISSYWRFIPNLKAEYFLQTVQQVVIDELIVRRIQIEFIKFVGFDNIRKIENILLVFKDWWLLRRNIQW